MHLRRIALVEAMEIHHSAAWTVMIRRIRAEVTREVSAFRREGQESRWLSINRNGKNQRPSSGEPGPCQCHFLPQETARLIPLPEGRLLAPQKIKMSRVPQSRTSP